MARAVRQLVTVWAALLALLASTIGAIFLPLGSLLPAVTYAIAIVKAALVLWFFMGMKREDGLARLAMAAGFAWLATLFILTVADNATRGMIGSL